MSDETRPLSAEEEAVVRQTIRLTRREYIHGDTATIARLLATIDAARASAPLDAVYRDRNLVVQAFAATMEDEGWHVAWGIDPSEPDWPVLYIQTSAGQVSWHIPKAERIYEPTDRTASFGPMVWDGHTDGEKFDRLRSFVASTPKGEPST